MNKKRIKLLLLVAMLLCLITACNGNQQEVGADKGESDSWIESEDSSTVATESESQMDGEIQTGTEQDSQGESEDGTQEPAQKPESSESESESAKPEPSESESETTKPKPPESESETTKPEPPESESETTKPKPSELESETTKPEPSESESETTKPKPSESESESSEEISSATEGPNNSEDSPITEEYAVTVKSSGNYRLYNVKVNIYSDSTMRNLIASAATNSNGRATFQLEPSEDYVITLSNVVEGYQVKNSYSFKGHSVNIILDSQLITDKDILTAKLKEGHVMYNFSVTNAKGETLVLSEILKEKKMVMLNFWYVNCAFCVAEFPYMSTAYETYQEDVEIIALNPYYHVDSSDAFLEENPLPFEVASCPAMFPNVFGVEAYPVSVVIDRYGVIREIHTGAILEEGGFEAIFKKYTR